MDEVLGPASFEAWCESYEVLSTALLMLDVVRRPRLIAYRNHIQEFAEMHGPQGWALLYQADVRCRQEWMESIRCRLQLAHTTALALGTTTSFRADKPWDSVWEAAVEDEKFWKREFERPAGKLSNFLAGVEGDAPIHRGASSHSQPNLPNPPPRQQQLPPVQARQPQPQRASWRTHNDSSPPEELCRGFQDGSCRIGQGHHGQCGRDKKLRQQCAICLGTRHGALQCPPGEKGGKHNQQGNQKRGQGGGKNQKGKKRKGGY